MRRDCGPELHPEAHVAVRVPVPGSVSSVLPTWRTAQVLCSILVLTAGGSGRGERGA